MIASYHGNSGVQKYELLLSSGPFARGGVSMAAGWHQLALKAYLT